MQITVNGKPHHPGEGSTIRDLLAALGVNTPLVAVEQNRVIVPKARHAVALLRDGDVIEVVTLVGGG